MIIKNLNVNEYLKNLDFIRIQGIINCTFSEKSLS